MGTLTEEAPPPPPTTKATPFFRRFSAPVLAGVIILHLLFGGVAAIWVVSRYSAARKLTFNAGPNPPTRANAPLSTASSCRKKPNPPAPRPPSRNAS